MGRAEDFLASITRIAPQAVIDPSGDEVPDPFEALTAKLDEVIARPSTAIERITEPVFYPEPVDIGPLLQALNDSRLDPTALAGIIGNVVAATVGDVLARQADTGVVLEALVKEMTLLRKKFNGVVAGGGGGGPSAVELRTANKEPVGEDNPLPVVVAGPSGTWDYTSGTNGAAVIPPGARVTQITAVALGAQGSFTINGGTTITLPYDSTDKASSSIDMPIVGTLVAPAIVFDANVDAYTIQLLV